VARTAFAFVWVRRRLRIALLLALCLAALGVGGWIALRGSSLSAVEKVRIGGAQGRQAAQIEAALRGTARGMSTLHVNVGALRAAVARFPVVRDLRVSPSFPHGLRITVIEQPPVAVLSAGGQRTAVAADGVVLGPEPISSALPSVRLAGVVPLTGRSVSDATTRAELSILGAAPPTLLGWVQSISSGSEGIVAAMRGGVQIYFGNATRAHAKWLAAARVLADSSAAGATYIDVRVPGRPVAGTSAPGGLSGASASSGTGATSLSARLDEAVSGGSAEAATTAATSPPVGAGETASSTGEGSGSGTGEAGSGGTESTEASAGGSAGSTGAGESSGAASAGETAPSGAAGSAGSAGATAEAGGAAGETAGNQGAATASGGAVAGGG
jgi:cell division protein FtsQ